MKTQNTSLSYRKLTVKENSILIVGFVYLVCFLIPIGSYTQTIHYVKEGASGLGTSWEDASGDLQAIINISSANDQIWVAHGTYYPNRRANNLGQITFNHPHNSFVLKPDVKIYGGFPNDNAGTMINRDWSAYPSILNGDMDNNINTYNAYHVVISTGDVGNAELNGFKIIGGDGSSGSGNISVNSHTVYPSIGGGMYTISSSPIITNCIFSENKAVEGGAIGNRGGCSPIITNCIFSGNQAIQSGGAIYSTGYSSVALNNCLIVGNKTSFNGKGSAIYSDFHSSLIINNCTISSNTSSGYSPIYIIDIVSYKIYNSIVFLENLSGHNLHICDIRNSLIKGTNNNSYGDISAYGVNATDIFVDPQPAGLSTTGDYSLQNNYFNPAVNAGKDSLYLSLSTKNKDLLENPRSNDCSIDLGAYELQHNFTTPWYPITNDFITYNLNDPSNPLTATPSNPSYVIRWYSDSAGENILSFAPSPSTLNTGIISYFVSQTDTINHCEGPIKQINILITGGTATGLDFDGVDDYIEILSPQGLPSGNSSYTMEAWIKPRSFRNNTLIDWGNYDSLENSNILRFDSQTMLANSNGSSYMYKPYVFFPDQWYHIAVTYSNVTSIMTLYVNGVSIGTKYMGTNGIDIIPDNIKLGHSNNVNFNNFEGIMDEVRIWNVARTQFEIDTHKDCPLQGNENGLVAYYQFNQGLAYVNNLGINILTDKTVNNNAGVLQNFELDEMNSNWVYAKLRESIPSSSEQTNASCNGNEDGSATIYVAGDSNTYNYVWFPNEENSNTAINLSAGTYTVTITNDNKCAILDIIITEPLPIDPPIFDTQFFCDSANVGDLSTIESNIYWYSQLDSEHPLPLLTPLSTANYFVSKIIDGCESTRATVSIIITSINNNITPSGSVELIAAQSGAAYQWIDCSNDTPVSGATSQSFTPAQNGSYSVELTVNGCTATSNCMTVTSVGIETIETVQWAIAPNPGGGVYIITTSQYLQDLPVEVVTVSGQVIYSGIYSDYQQIINLENQPNGVYFLKVNQQVFRIIKI